jgi:ribonuclease HI
MFPKIKTQLNNNNTIRICPSLDYILRFDGCSKGNPGNAGCGAVIYHDGDEIWSDYCYVGLNATNNYAEYSGLILGLQKAVELKIDSLSVEGDSQLVIQQMNKVYRCKSSNLFDLHEKASELASNFNIIYFTHIYRNKNKRADELSNMAILDYEKNVVNDEIDTLA